MINGTTSEKLIVGSFAILFLFIVIVAQYQHSRMADQLNLNSAQIIQPIVVSIDGAVRKPGEYKLVPGAALSEAVRKSAPSRFADLSSLNLDQPVHEDIHITISELSVIQIHVEGAVVEAATVMLPVGSRICDLKSKVCFTENADRAFLKRRRLLKNGEVLVIPKNSSD